LLINTMPTRVDVDPRQTVTGYLAARHRKQVELREHEHSSLVDIQHHTDIPVGTPLFDSIFIYENLAADSDPGLHIEPCGQALERTECPLVVEASQHDAITLTAIYHRARFTGEDCERLLGHVENLLRGMTEAPDSTLSEVDALSAAERDLVLRRWN